MKWNMISACAGILITLGIVILLIPLISNTKYNYIQEYKTEKFIEDCSETEKDTTTNSTNKKSEEIHKSVIDIEGLRRDIEEYNKRIYEEKQCNLKDKSSYQVASLNLYEYGFQDGVYGYLSVDKLGLNMPIYLGANDYNMSLGAAHMSHTSIPYGGENTHAVIAGHCGYGYMNYFRHIDSLQNGDKVKVTTPFGQLEYKVIEKVIIKPSEFEPLRIKEGKDLLTLFTCYPYPTNKYRYCVICERSLDE